MAHTVIGGAAFAVLNNKSKYSVTECIFQKIRFALFVFFDAQLAWTTLPIKITQKLQAFHVVFFDAPLQVFYHWFVDAL